MKTMYDFRKYVEREKNKRRGAFFFNFQPDEGLLFQEEMQYLREILSDLRTSGGFVPLNKEVRFPDEMTDAQITCYYSLIPGFRDEEFEKNQKHYGNLYLLEMANLLYHRDPAQALRAMFRFRDEMHMTVDNNEYFMRLCDSFVIAHPELASDMTVYRRARGLLAYRDLWDEIRSGVFDGATQYVKNNARLLKENELSGEKDFCRHAWNAIPDVFYALDRRLGRERSSTSFREIATAGKEERIYLNLLPVKGIQDQGMDRITLGDGVTIRKEKGYGKADGWYRQAWRLYDSSGDFLYVIYLYTESFMREQLKGPKRAASAERILKKNYRRNDDLPRNIRAMKDMIRDERFAQAVREGVQAYMDAHPEILRAIAAEKAEKERSRSRKRAMDDRRRREDARERQKKEIYDMDHETIVTSAIDKERLKKVKQEMDHMTGMLHQGSIDYDKS